MIAPTTETTAVDMRQAMIEAFTEAAGRGVDVAVVVADSTSTSKVKPFMECYPQRVINVGIAEQNMVGVAAGLALGGMVPFTCNAAPFLLARAHEQVKNDVCYSRANVKLVGLNAGIAYGPLGSTHHAIDDIAIMRGLGSVDIVAPVDAVEARAVFEYAFTHQGPLYIRMDSLALPLLHDPSYCFAPGAVDTLRAGTDVTVCCLGTVAHEAIAAAETLRKEGIDAAVLSFSSIRPLDTAALLDSARATGRVVTVEEHTRAGGLGSLVAEAVVEAGVRVRMERRGFSEGVFPAAGPRAHMRASCGIDAGGICAAVRRVCDV